MRDVNLIPMGLVTKKSLVLVQGLYVSAEPGKAVSADSAVARRAKMFAEHGDLLGVRDYEWVEGRGRALANRLLRLARGTARAVDAVEIIELDEAAVRDSLADDAMRSHWQQMASCAPCGFDAARSFILIGSSRQLLEGSGSGRRILWFGRGLSSLRNLSLTTPVTMARW